MYDEDYDGSHEMVVVEDDFEKMAEYGRSVQGGGMKAPIKYTDWARLAQGQTLGKRAVAVWDGTHAEGNPNTAPVNILSVQGPDDASINLCLTLAAPKLALVNNLAALPADPQSVSGSQDNQQLLDTWNGGGPFPNLHDPYAIIEWGTGGVAHRAEVDISNGLCVNLSGSYLRAQVALVSRARAGTNAAYELAGSISQGWGKARSAQKTLSAQILGGSDLSSFFATPKFAKTVHLGGSDTNNNVFVGTIRFWNGPSNASISRVVAQYLFAGNSFTPAPVPNGAYFFDILSGMDTALAKRWTAVFDLAI